jgi:hypothetical protein
VKLGAKGLDIRWGGLRRTPRRLVAADLIISVGGVVVKYNVYLGNKAELQFSSTDRSRVELAARLLKLAGVNTEAKKREGRDVWYVIATTDRLAAGREELRKALADIVRKAVENGWMDASKAGRWLEKLEGGLTLWEGWPRYNVQLILKGRREEGEKVYEKAKEIVEEGRVEGLPDAEGLREGGRSGRQKTQGEGHRRRSR